MDNNLVSVDDLVRQRLSGAEEREPSGAWLRMRELLDEKEDRKPVGFMWRRMFGGLAIIAMLGTLSLGGYEITSHYRSLGTGNGTELALNTTASNSSSLPANAINNKDYNKLPNSDLNNSNNKKITTTDGKNENNPTSNPLNKKNTNGAGNNKTMFTTSGKNKDNNNGNELQISNHPVVAASISGATMPKKADEKSKTGASTANNVDLKHKSSVHNPVEKINNHNEVVATSGNNKLRNNKTRKGHSISTSDNNNNNNDEVAISGNDRINNSTTGKEKLTTSNNNNSDGAATPGDESTSKNSTQKEKLTASTNNNSDEATAPDNDELNNKTTKREKFIASSKTDHPNSNSLKNKTADHKPASAKNSGINKSGNSTVATAGTKKQKGAGKVIGKTNQTSLAVKNVKQPGKKVDTRVSGKDTKTEDADDAISVNSLAIGSSHPTDDALKKKLPVKNPIIAEANKTNSAGKKLAAKGSSTYGNGTKPSNEDKDNKPIAKKMPFASSGNNIAAIPGGNAGSNTTPVNKDTLRTRMAKKIIQKLTIQERITKTGPNTYVTHQDTISYETINEEFADNDDIKVFGPPTVKQFMSAGKLAANNGSKLIIPGASSEWSDEEATEKAAGKLARHEKSVAKGGAGLSQSLENAVNDIKYSISGARFAAGLKGGINSTFFGPNNFKGFQMGVTGNFIFSENVNILAELEYFQRINSGYILNDDYYTYTQIGPNMWSRQQIQNPFSFSTLHSFELPLIVRYTKKNFSIFAGGNLVYTLAINESQGIATPGATTQVAAVGNDTKPTIKESDFNGRFGLGYVFGAAIQLSPVISLDIRDVQTLWDNAGSTGSQAVSTQLFRSPSFQLSMGYRFGGKKAKQKE